MAMEWPVDKLSLINRALALTGNYTVNVADDGSDEWNACSPAYETGLGLMMEDHGWGFADRFGQVNNIPFIRRLFNGIGNIVTFMATGRWVSDSQSKPLVFAAIQAAFLKKTAKLERTSDGVIANLPASPTAPTNTAWDTAYPLPGDLLHLIWVQINQSTSILGQQCPYDLEDGKLVLNAQGGPPPPSPPVAPSQVSIKYVSTTNADPVNATPLFIVALQSFVMSGIYRGLHEDTVEGDRVYQAAEMMLQQARTRYDQQKPKRSFWNSRITAARRVRRPWPTSPGGWGGTGSPA